MPFPIQIDEEQNVAIRTEVAERLRTMPLLGRAAEGATLYSAIDRSAGRIGGQIEA
jgi:hypothetical protein